MRLKRPRAMVSERIHYKTCVEKAGICRGSIVSVVGSGGKTTLIEGMAGVLAEKFRVAVATSVKIYCPPPDASVILKDHLPAYLPAETGIYYLADERLEKEGKLHGFCAALAAWAMAHMDVILIEADGSRQLPLKGWADREPVIVPQTQMTIGVLPLSLLGKKIGPAQVHRWDRFCRITHMSEGDVLTLEHLVQIITSPEGLFGKAAGRRILYLSQIRGEAAEQAAAALKKESRLENIDEILTGRTRP